MNKLLIIGNLTRDPETRATQSGKTVCSFDVAVNDPRGDQEKPTYFRVSAWGKTGESCQRYLSKGRKVFVSGPLSYRTYQASDGTTRVTLEVTANEVEFLSNRNEGNANSTFQTAKNSPLTVPNGYTAVETDELPF